MVPIETAGERVLVGSNGTFLEVRRAWGYFIRLIGEVTMSLPFGSVEEVSLLLVPKVPRALFEEFVQLAKAAPDQEVGASIVWNERDRSFRLLPSTALHSTHSKLDYRIPDLNDGEHIVVDCHSHSYHGAGFSPTDDKDDAHSVKFAFVVGHCHLPTPSFALRLCVRGHFQGIPYP
jgi:PRTRC genetic system protein A